MKLALAAPASFFSAAAASQADDEPPASASHFFKETGLAAPASFFSAAWASQAALAAKAWPVKAAKQREASEQGLGHGMHSNRNGGGDGLIPTRDASARNAGSLIRLTPRGCARQRMRRGCASDSWAACGRRTSTWMKPRSKRCWHSRLSWAGVSGVKEMVVHSSLTRMSVLCLRAAAGWAPGRPSRRPRCLGPGGDKLPVTKHLDLALGRDVEAVALLTALVERVAHFVAAPARAAHHFPELDVAKAGEELQAAQ